MLLNIINVTVGFYSEVKLESNLERGPFFKCYDKKETMKTSNTFYYVLDIFLYINMHPLEFELFPYL